MIEDLIKELENVRRVHLENSDFELFNATQPLMLLLLHAPIHKGMELCKKCPFVRLGVPMDGDKSVECKREECFYTSVWREVEVRK